VFVIKFPKWKPAPAELDLPKAQLTALANDVSRQAMNAQLEMMGARSAEELAIAVAKLHGALNEASSSWSVIAEQTRHWAH
jgi:tryptophan synthase beta subunit